MEKVKRMLTFLIDSSFDMLPLKIIKCPVTGKNETILYQTNELPEYIEVRIDEERETFWLLLNQISNLFERDKSIIPRHLKNIFKNKELDKNAVVAKNATTATDGKTYNVEHFNLDAILSVGYTVNSKRGTQFRVWASRVLRDYLLKEA
ncbi:RhuM family protein [Aquiflexum lacus]|uniref:RhuM family protein n=1 Tax=Aquiflexum lacus TaxID=2483805 RepID=UPI001E3F310F|nr:RhuM family protein [Aquiflexum lacus]